MAQTIAVLSQKGGTGKTTTVRTLADALRRARSEHAGGGPRPAGQPLRLLRRAPRRAPTISDVLSGRAQAAEAIHGDVIPANLNLAETELSLGGRMGRELTLRRALAKLPDDAYELVLIDCPPSLGLLTVNALVAADYALITAEAQYFALQGVEQALEVIELARDTLNPELELLGVLLNLADMRTVHSREALASLREQLGERVLADGCALLDRLRRIRRARHLDPRPPPRPRRRLCRGRRRAAGAAAWIRAGARAARSKLHHVSPLRLERGAQQLRPALDLRPQRLHHDAGLLVEAPHQHRRTGAGDRGAERAQLPRAAGKLKGAREEVRAVLLVQAVVQARAPRGPSRRGRGRASAARRGRR